MEIRPILSALLRSKTGAVLIAAQIALTLAIVSNGTFVVRQRLATADRPSGVDEPNTFQLAFVAARPIGDKAGMLQRDLETLRALPGVAAASGVNQFPMSRSGWDAGVSADPQRPETATQVAIYMGDETLLDAFGVRLAEGRNFEPGEVKEIDPNITDPASDSVLITRHLARRMFPGETSVAGKQIYWGAGADARPMRVVGVVDMLMGPSGDSDPRAYDSLIMPIRLLGERAQYVVRAEPGQRARVQAAAEAALTALRNDRVRTNNRTMDELRRRRYLADTTGAGMLIAVTIGLLIVTGSGIVGVASLWVSQRRRQIGVRRALGAGRLDILRYFVTENLLISTAGVVTGAVLAIGLNQWLVGKVALGRLPLYYPAIGTVALWTLGVIAVLGPAWRATTVPPAIATRGG